MPGFFCHLQFFSVGLIDQFLQIWNGALDLLRRTFQQVLTFCRNGISAFQGFMEAAVYLGKLLVGEKLTLLNQTGTDCKVLLGALIIVSIVVTLPQTGLIIAPFPGNKLNAVLTGFSSKYGAVEVRKQLIFFT